MNSPYLHSAHPMKRIARVPLLLSRGRTVLALVLTVLLFLRPASAGDLNPPPGPVAATGRFGPRIEVNAVNTPGDNDATPSKYKITLPGSYYLGGNVMGDPGKIGIEIAASGVTLDLMGFDLEGVPVSLDGVSVSVGATDIAVVNGSVRKWAQDGVDVRLASDSRLADLRVSGNTGKGILAGTAVVTGCAAYLNGSDGFNISLYSSITNCSARTNGGAGIFAVGSTITNCSGSSNTGVGIDASSGSTITNCSANENTLDGIRVFSDCTVRGNTCDSNGFGAGDGAGIHATSSDNRIEGNNCTDNDRGIDVDVSGNFITRNTCSGNTTNWDVVAANACLVVSTPANAAILGDNGGVSPGSTDPNANFTY